MRRGQHADGRRNLSLRVESIRSKPPAADVHRARPRNERSCKQRLRASYLQRGGSGALTMVQILACTASMYTPVSL